MLRAVLSFLVMVATTCLVFAAIGILTWRMALAVLVGSTIGAALARVRLSPTPRSRTRSAQ